MGAETRGQGKAYAFLRSLIGHTGTDCVPWPFSKNHKGYGIVGFNGRIYKANRMMCELAHGPAPTAKHQAAHTCGNGHTGCVNPRHLEWKTNLENQLDRFEHGTMPKPGKPRRILTPEQIAKVRALKGKVGQVDLALLFGVKPGTIEYWQGHDRAPRVLSADQVRAIRAIGTKRPTRDVAEQFGVSESSIRRVIRGDVYQDAAPVALNKESTP